MCSKKPEVPDNTQETPAVLMTAGGGSATPEANSTGRKKLRIDLNDSTPLPTTGYGSSIVPFPGHRRPLRQFAVEPPAPRPVPG